MVADSRAERQEVYGWLFRSRHKSARQSHPHHAGGGSLHRYPSRWQRLGYPFDNLVPSLATALGSSGDRPAALAELMGIILNDGVRLPSVRIDNLHFAEGTPYETRLGFVAGSGKRVMPAEVARALQDALANVVEGGTARRLQRCLQAGGWQRAAHRWQDRDRRQPHPERRRRRPADQFAGAEPHRHLRLLSGAESLRHADAYVPGRAADSFRFTSALPVQTLKGMAPILQPYLQGANSLCQPEHLPALTSGMLSAEN